MGQTHSSSSIHIHDLLLTLAVGGAPTPVLLSLVVPHDVAKAARADDLSHTLNYAAVYATLVGTLPGTSYPTLDALLDSVFAAIFHAHPRVTRATVVATLRDTSPRCTIEATRKRKGATRPCRVTLSGLTFSTIVGVSLEERTATQPVSFDIVVQRKHRTKPFPFFDLSTSVRQTFAPSKYHTIETLASAVARHVLEYTRSNDHVTVHLSKPNALPLASAQVQVSGKRANFGRVPLPVPKIPSAVEKASAHSVALALGSNLGDRFANIETALRLLEIPSSVLTDLPGGAEVAVVDTSFMYETTPMYVTDQPRFVNCACMIETNLSPEKLLRLVKAIETAVGRVPSERFGPRAVDVDIITYDDQCIDTRPPNDRATLDNLVGELVVPHPRLCEREFVLRPLSDMIPDFVHPTCHKSIRTLLDDVSAIRRPDEVMSKVLPFPKYPIADTHSSIHGVQVPPTATHWTVSGSPHSRPPKTYLMGILNATPDSFSDGAQHNTVPAALGYTGKALASGADMIDIGGHSTRPGADPVATEAELWRVIPIINAIRAHDDARVRDALVSVDTFRYEVAEEAVRAGANCINDVYAFSGPGYSPDDDEGEKDGWTKEMKRVARGLGVPVVLMHSRGEASQHNDYGQFPGGVLEGVRTELGAKVDKIVRGRGGLRRWLVVVDPGIGFSKDVEGQLALMRDSGRVTAHDDRNMNLLAGYPLLVGPSKKSVLGAVLERGDGGRKTSAGERAWATAAAVACAVQQGASVVRVHDVPEMRDVVAVANAIWNR